LKFRATVNRELATGSKLPLDDMAASVGESWTRVVVVSNRLPFRVAQERGCRPVVVPSSGGLVTAMSPLMSKGVGGKWIGWQGAGEEEGLEEALRTAPEGRFDFGVVRLTPEEVREYYQGYANSVLAPLLEGHIDHVDMALAHSCWNTYQNVQMKFAWKARNDLRPRDIVWVHDYHLAGVGRSLRNLGVKQPIGYFLHLPFPARECIARLPQRERFLRDLLAYDIVALQTRTFRRNFNSAVQAYVPGAGVETVSDDVNLIRFEGRIVRVGNFAAGIDADEFLEQADAPAAQAYARDLESGLRRAGCARMIFDAGRLDYTKGFYEELLAFDRLLEKHPGLAGRIALYQLVIPSRESIPAYRLYKDEISGLARAINGKYRGSGTAVVQMHADMDRSLYLAYLRVADIHCVPTKADGMNLISKEGAVVGKPTVVQLLGKNAGAAEELGDHALLIDPEDTERFADTLYRALTMDAAERRERKKRMAEIVCRNNVFQWWSKRHEPLFQDVWNEKKRIYGRRAMLAARRPHDFIRRRPGQAFAEPLQ
jgi:trehalose 6-phosphate synthase/phosphatase